MDYPIKVAAQLKQQLRALRQARRMNQTELGLRIGVTQTRIAEIEANPGVVSAEQLLKIFAALGAELVVRDNGPAADGRPLTTLLSHYPARKSPVIDEQFQASAKYLVSELGFVPYPFRKAQEAMLPDLAVTHELREALIKALSDLLGISTRELEDKLLAARKKPSSLIRMAKSQVKRELEGTLETDPPAVLQQWAKALDVKPDVLSELLRIEMKRRWPHGMLFSTTKGSW